MPFASVPGLISGVKNKTFGHTPLVSNTLKSSTASLPKLLPVPVSHALVDTLVSHTLKNPLSITVLLLVLFDLTI